MAEQPLALEWLVFIRDHGTDLKVTLGERALASLLPTYGQGKNIFVSMHSLSKVTGWSRNTVKKHRDGLIDKGLLEDITGDPDKQSRTYRLTMPDYEGRSNTDQGGSNNDLVVGQELTQGGSNNDHNIKLTIKPEDQASKVKATKGKRTRVTPEHLGLSLATSPRAALASSAPESARTYTYWQSKSTGNWLVFPLAEANYKPKDAQVVSLSVEEDEFYQKFFRGGNVNLARIDYLRQSPEARAQDIREVAQDPDLIPVPDDEYVLAV